MKLASPCDRVDCRWKAKNRRQTCNNFYILHCNIDFVRIRKLIGSISYSKIHGNMEMSVTVSYGQLILQNVWKQTDHFSLFYFAEQAHLALNGDQINEVENYIFNIFLNFYME